MDAGASSGWFWAMAPKSVADRFGRINAPSLQGTAQPPGIDVIAKDEADDSEEVDHPSSVSRKARWTSAQASDFSASWAITSPVARMLRDPAIPRST